MREDREERVRFCQHQQPCAVSGRAHLVIFVFAHGLEHTAALLERWSKRHGACVLFHGATSRCTQTRSRGRTYSHNTRATDTHTARVKARRVPENTRLRPRVSTDSRHRPWVPPATDNDVSTEKRADALSES